MREKNKIIADKQSKPSKLTIKKQDPVHSDQVVDRDKKAMIKKLLMERFPNGPVILEQAEKADPKESDNSQKKTGSHSLSQLHFFQNQHK